MKRKFFFPVAFFAVLTSGGMFLLQEKQSANNIDQELIALKSELASVKTTLATEQTKRILLEEKAQEARANAEFLTLALCPKIEISKEAACIKNSAGWIADTIQAGSKINNSETKLKMNALLFTLGEKKQPTVKEFYEMLRPVEVSALNNLVENLK